MKINRLLILLGALTLTSCAINSSSSTPGGEEGGKTDPSGDTDPSRGEGGEEEGGEEGGDTPVVPTTTPRMQDTPILHCWNWSMNNISNNLQSIKDAGFKTIQLSPMQVQKDYYNESIGAGWWKLYQPLSFSIANNNGENVLGKKDELKNMCAKAKSLGIDVIVDVVSNHLAGGSQSSFHGGVYNYEGEIANNNLLHNKGKVTGDDSIENIVQGTIGDFPDLKTEDERVQNRVISLLKDYIDVGINGFRFDAAKHIETPDDGSWASNYWPNVLGAATSYAKSKNLDEPYYYGEILNIAGKGRSFSSYTKYMSVVDSNQGSDLLKAVNGKKASSIKSTFNSGVDPSQLVLWAESHDTFANDKGESKDISQDIIDKTYIIQASRKDASVLYLARPSSMGASLGSVGSRSFEGKAIKAINNFHNQFIGQKEEITIDKDCFINTRGNEGVVFVNINNSSSSIKFSVPKLENGSYTDLITNKKYTVTNNEVTISFTDGACILVSDSKESTTPPTLELSSNSQIFSTTASINVNASNATSITYSINGGSASSLSGTTINIPSSTNNGPVSVKVTATNKYGSVNKTISLFKTTSLINKSLIIYNLDTKYDYYCWSWKGSASGKFYSPTMEGNAAGYDLGDNDMFIIVKMNKGSSADWNNAINQTTDNSLTDKVVDYTSLTIK